MPSGLAPEEMHFDASGAMSPTHASNFLRPETVESLYYMWYFTGDEKYQRWAYNIFQAFERHSKATFGYAATSNVKCGYPKQQGTQESFWMAETLKYLFLIFSPKSTLDLSK